jgi:hypothetical protein
MSRQQDTSERPVSGRFVTPAVSEPIAFSSNGGTPAMLAEAFGMTAGHGAA